MGPTCHPLRHRFRPECVLRHRSVGQPLGCLPLVLDKTLSSENRPTSAPEQQLLRHSAKQQDL